MTFNWKQNELKLQQYLKGIVGNIGKELNPDSMSMSFLPMDANFDLTKYVSTHNVGGAVMGDNPKTSALNKYLQSWDVPNVFVPGASAFPQGLGYNPTGMVAALTYWSAKAIREQYLKNPGPLVQA